MSDSAYLRRRRIEYILMSGKRVTIPQLMRKFDVGRNTIRKDMDYLSMMIPIESKQGYNGGYYLAEGCSKRHDLLTEKELNCLYILRESCPEEMREVLDKIIEDFGPCDVRKNERLSVDERQESDSCLS